jgi:hypothetical protein
MNQRKRESAGGRRGAPAPPRKITPHPPRPNKPLLAAAVLLLAGWLAVLAMLAAFG